MNFVRNKRFKFTTYSMGEKIRILYENKSFPNLPGRRILTEIYQNDWYGIIH
jgi:hypothetical protein